MFYFWEEQIALFAQPAHHHITMNSSLAPPSEAKSELLHLSEKIQSEHLDIQQVLDNNRISKRSIDLLIKSGRTNHLIPPLVAVTSPREPTKSTTLDLNIINEINAKIKELESSIDEMDRSHCSAKQRHNNNLSNSRSGGLDRIASTSNVSLHKINAIEDTTKILNYFRKPSTAVKDEMPSLPADGDELQEMVKNANGKCVTVQNFLDRYQQIVDSTQKERAPISLNKNLSEKLQQIHEVSSRGGKRLKNTFNQTFLGC